MTFINFIINKPLLPKNHYSYLLNHNNFINMNMNNDLPENDLPENDLPENNKLYNPIIGSELGIPLNILQFIFTTNYYNENIIFDNKELILLQFAIGIFTYGTDRLFDALEYKNKYDSNKYDLNQFDNTYKLEKINYYTNILNNYNISRVSIIGSYIFILYILLPNEDTYIFLFLLTSTLKYKQIKTNFGLIKSSYIAIFWTVGTIILPCVYYDNTYEILNHPINYLPTALIMFGSSNFLDISDIEEDKKENINTLPVIYGKENIEAISNISIILGIFMFIASTKI